MMNEPLALWRGVNIEGWLDDRLLPPAQRPLFFGPADAATSSMRLNEPVADNPDDKNLILTFH